MNSAFGDPSESQQAVDFTDKDAEAQLIILNAIITDCESAREMWQLLESKHAKRSESDHVSLAET